MILNEYGLHFTRDGDRWHCVEWPALTMRGDLYEADGQRFATLSLALADRHSAELVR